MKPTKIPAIFFQGKPLPASSVFLDVGADEDIVGEDTSIWFFRFTVCAGRSRSAPAVEAVTHAMRLKKALVDYEQEVLGRIGKRLSWLDPPIVVAEWIAALDIIIEASAGLAECEWHGED